MVRHFISQLKINFVNEFPALSQISRFSKALYYNIVGTRQSYSQHGEDQYILEALMTAFPGKDYKYIDVGAFHPMLLSNTYLLYRNNFTGATIEPNQELFHLHKTFRPKDIHLQLACNKNNVISKFYLRKTFPALSSLRRGTASDKKIKCDYIPVFNLDTIYQNLDFTNVHFLSIDVEGFDFEVLEGAQITLGKTFMLCIECNDRATEKKVKDFLAARGFSFIKNFSCNFIFKNERFHPGD